MALSPWPTTPAALATATTRLRALLLGGPGVTDESLTDERVQSLGAMAAARVEKEAPGAPQVVKDEATLRYSGYLFQADPGTVQSEKMGEGEVQYVVNHASAWRNCGAAGLLAPWRVMRAGLVG